MPFDGKNYQKDECLAPKTLGGDVMKEKKLTALGVLRDARYRMIETEGRSCLWVSISEVSADAKDIDARLTAAVMVARELYVPLPDHVSYSGNWMRALHPIYDFNDSHTLAERVALIDRAIKAAGG